MREIVVNKNLIAFCGLYCGACKKYLSGKCLGCNKNDKASWCKVRTCCLENNYLSCADCEKMSKTEDCVKLNNFISKVFAVVFRSNRNACIREIRESGYEIFAEKMSKTKAMTIKK